MRSSVMVAPAARTMPLNASPNERAYGVCSARYAIRFHSGFEATNFAYMLPWSLVLGWVRATKPLWSPCVTASAPETPMRNTCASTQRGLTARVTAEAQVETIATTLLTSISLRAARTPASALVWSSSWKSCTGRPWMPPLLLIRSTTATTERCMSGPYDPPAPVSGHKVPMLIGCFDCADPIPGAPSTSPAAADPFKTSRRVIILISNPPPSHRVRTSSAASTAEFACSAAGSAARTGEYACSVADGAQSVRSAYACSAAHSPQSVRGAEYS